MAAGQAPIGDGDAGIAHMQQAGGDGAKRSFM
jgi:hypothetical protein